MHSNDLNSDYSDVYLSCLWRLKLVVMKGDDLKNMKDFLAEKKFIGTVIS